MHLHFKKYIYCKYVSKSPEQYSGGNQREYDGACCGKTAAPVKGIKKQVMPAGNNGNCSRLYRGILSAGMAFCHFSVAPLIVLKEQGTSVSHGQRSAPRWIYTDRKGMGAAVVTNPVVGAARIPCIPRIHSLSWGSGRLSWMCGVISGT